MDVISLLIVVAFLLIAADMAGRDRHPLVLLAGLVLLGFGILSRLFGGGSPSARSSFYSPKWA